jgi:hypothetical protein
LSQFSDIVNGVIRYFDLFSRRRSTVAQALSDGETEKTVPSWWWQLLLYLALLAGIFTKGVLEYSAGRAPDPFDWGRIFFALVAATIAFPGAYKAAMEEAGPGLVQICLVFTSGIGVKTVVDAS